MKILLLAILAATASLPERNLRGYGKSAAVFSGDTVAVTAESPEKALLWAARYDHVYAKWRVRPGVYRLPGGGWTRLAVKGNRFGVKYSAEEPSAGYAGKLPQIPMYLNSWDDYSFKFYYRQGAAPWDSARRVGTPWAQYDPKGEFEFAAKNDKAGLIFWTNNHRADTAIGMNDVDSWLWAGKLAREYGLPVVLNTNGMIPMWVTDFYREENLMKAPGYLGGYHSMGGNYQTGEGFLDWASVDARQEVLDVLANALQENNAENVIEFMEPHGELAHGEFTVFLEHGPVADASFRNFLREKYGKISAVAKRWKESNLSRWEEITLPAIADFAGYGPNATDLEGEWQYRLAKDADWTGKVLRMPGHDIGLFLPEERAVIRRTFRLNSRTKGKGIWLYVWDLSNRARETVVARLNGTVVAEDHCSHGTNHWMVREVSKFLKSGTNEIELELPNGRCAYKVYLTGEEPKAYPYFGEGKNAKWADWCAWQQDVRKKAVRRGLETLRSVEPNKSILAMAPDKYYTDMRELAAEFGTRFHNTGYMAAFWCERLPMLMRSKGLPFSLEPGGPAHDVKGFKRMTNYYLSEGVNGIHYFIHIGSVFWDDEIRAEFERRLPALKMMGRYAQPQNEIAELMDSSIDQLLGYPWRQDLNSAYPSGYMDWRFPAVFGDSFQIDGVTPYDFANGDIAKYRFVLDSNTTVMTPDQVRDIERYVRGGGTFVAMFQSGRHAPEKPDCWMLDELAGVKHLALDNYAYVPDKQGQPRITLMSKRRKAIPETELVADGADEMKIVPSAACDGASLEPTAADVKTLVRWEDGSAAVTLRQVGNGRIIVFGLRPGSLYGGWEFQILSRILTSCGAKKKVFSARCGRGMGRQYLTNDGLFDVFYLDQSDKDGVYSISFRDGKSRPLTNVLTGEEVPLEGSLSADDFIMATSPHGEEASAAWHWVQNQFGWWQGGWKGERPRGARKVNREDWVLDLSDGWKVADSEKRIEPWVYGEEIFTNAYVCTRKFTVPASWTDAEIELWGVGTYSFMFSAGQFAVRLDGREIQGMKREGIDGLRLPVRPGETHTLELLVTRDNHPRVRGFGGPIYLYRRPNPKSTLDLSGPWEAFRTFSDATPSVVSLPGKYGKAVALRRSVIVPADWKHGRVRIDYTTQKDRLTGVIVNGHYLRRYHHFFGPRTDLDITPWIVFGQKNEIILVGDREGREGSVDSVFIKK